MPPRKRTSGGSDGGTVTALPSVDQPSLEQILTDNRTLLEVLDAAVDQMSWLSATDAAMVKLGQEQARSIDDAVSIAAELEDLQPFLDTLAGDGVDIASLVKRLRAIEAAANAIKVIGWIGPEFAKTLRDLGGSPAERKGLEGDNPAKSKLSQLRDQATKQKAAGAKASD